MITKRGSFRRFFFSYLSSPTKIKPKPWKSEEERLRKIEANIGEQPGTLVLAESEMRRRFIPIDRFTPLLVTNIVGFFAALGAIVGILTGTGVINFQNLPAQDWSKPLWLLIVIIVGSVAFVYAILSPLISYALRRKWSWWRKNVLP